MSSEIQIWPEALPVPLITRNNSFNPRGSNTVMDSKRIRTRRSFQSPIQFLSAKWNFTEDQFETFKAFFEDDLVNGSELFEFVSREYDEDPHFMIETTWVLAFWEGKYAFAFSDNVYAVSATLLCTESVDQTIETPDELLPPGVVPTGPPLVPVYPTLCRDEIQFEIEMAPGDEYSLQIGESSGGPWHDHVFVKLENAEEEAAGKKTVRLNNDYRGQYYFRVVRTSTAKLIYKPVLPQASAIEPPTISIAGVDDVIALRPMWNSAADFVYPYSYLENGFISNSSLYLVPRGRFEYFQDGLNWDGAKQIITVTGEDGATHKWTRDGNDPTEDTLDRKLEGTEGNIAAYRADFGYLIKARSFKDGCKSPVTMVLVDKRYAIRDIVSTRGLAATLLGYCDHTKTVNGKSYESGASCLVLWGSPDIYEDVIQGPETLFKTDLATDSDGLLYRRVKTIQDAIDGFGWLNHRVGTTVFDFDSAFFLRHPSTWDSLPACFTFATVGTGPEPLRGSTILFNYLEPTIFGETITTSAGDTTGILASAGAYIKQTLTTYADDPSSWVPFGNVNPAYLSIFDLVLTAHHDFKFFRDDSYHPPVVPLLPDPSVPEGYFDDFESYVDSDDADSLLLEEGTGWDGHWTIVSYVSGTGLEDFESYGDEVFEDGTSTLRFGQNYADTWTFATYRYGVVYFEDWEEYEDQDNLGLFMLFGAEDGWDTTEGWTIQGASVEGLEDFQSYADGGVTDLDEGVNYLPEAWTITDN